MTEALVGQIMPAGGLPPPTPGPAAAGAGDDQVVEALLREWPYVVEHDVLIAPVPDCPGDGGVEGR